MRIRLSFAQNVALGTSCVLLAACGASSPTTTEPPLIAVGGTFTAAQGGNTVVGNGGATTIGGTTASNPKGGATTGNGGATTGNGGATTSNGGATTGNGGATTSNGGATTSNGGATTSNGGGVTRGGTNGTGGATSTGSCVDTPRSSESCADAKAWGFCAQTWFAGNCKVTCGTCNATSGNGGSPGAGGAAPAGGNASVGGASATGGAATSATGGSTGTGTGVTVTPLSNGSSGITTRYWDCCMPSCSWAANAKADGKSSPSTVCAKDGNTVVGESAKSACSGGSGFQCNWGAPWQAGDNVSYGFAAHNGGNCGKCYQLDFSGTGDNAGAKALAGKSMIVQVVNTGGIAANQFDLLIPGGGVGANNACTAGASQWGSVPAGATYGGFLATCGTSMTCVTDMCKAAFGSNTGLMGGCNWFVGWFNGANNPGVKYAEVACPAAITNKSGLK